MKQFNGSFYITGVSAQPLTFKKHARTHVAPRGMYSLSFRLSGCVMVDHWRVGEGDVLYVPAGVAYTTEVMEHSEALVAHFTAEGDLPREPWVLSCGDSATYVPLFLRMVQRFSEGRCDPEAMGAIYEVWARLQKDSRPSTLVVSPRMRRARRTIEQRGKSESLSVAELAREAGVSEAYFRKEFKTTFGCSPLSYIRQMRIAYAKFLLDIGNDTVSEVAMKCGYDTLPYFSYDFHKVVGVSPREYRQQTR